MVIYESLFYGCPVLCSNNTPCDRLDEFNAGWHLNASKVNEFVTKLTLLIKYNFLEYQKLLVGTQTYLDYTKTNLNEKNNLELFN